MKKRHSAEQIVDSHELRDGGSATNWNAQNFAERVLNFNLAGIERVDIDMMLGKLTGHSS
ncbi:MAG: hypothetical protein QGF67_15460 [Lentisphaeria bacterium]|jgi:hypothetical protein|nr:hypothetical protein [Lentisphaeria bacterium]MDP7742836.1 hypothetical protein [Lentisphaeria bacterium]